MADAPYLVAWMASHIRGGDQVEELRVCLASIVCQSVTPHVLLISWSSTDTSLAAAVASAIKDAQSGARREFIVSLPQPVQRSQFQHFDACRRYVEEIIIGDRGRRPENLWCLFSDDDDIWHSDRCKTYLNAVRGASQQLPREQLAQVGSFLCSTFATEALERADYEEAWRDHHQGQEVGLRESPQDAADVAKWLATGRACLADHATKSADGTANKSSCEYWQYLISFPVILEFLASARPALLQSTFCDMALRTHLTCNLGRPICELQAPAGNFLYYHSKRKALHGTSMSQALVDGEPPRYPATPQDEPSQRAASATADPAAIKRSLAGARRHAELAWATAYVTRVPDGIAPAVAARRTLQWLTSQFEAYVTLSVQNTQGDGSDAAPQAAQAVEWAVIQAADVLDVAEAFGIPLAAGVRRAWSRQVSDTIDKLLEAPPPPGCLAAQHKKIVQLARATIAALGSRTPRSRSPAANAKKAVTGNTAPAVVPVPLEGCSAQRESGSPSQTWPAPPAHPAICTQRSWCGRRTTGDWRIRRRGVRGAP